MRFAIADPLVGSIHQLNFREAGLEAGIVQIKILRLRRMGIIGLLRRHRGRATICYLFGLSAIT
jgi:hypothetical protein